MEYRKSDGFIILRADPGEDLCQTILDVCAKEGIKFANVTGIGAAGEITCGSFDPNTKEYHTRTFQGVFEITSLNGTVSAMNGEPYEHIHITFADPDLNVQGGHVNKCVISATAEVILQILPGEIDRFASKEVGLNLFKLN